MAATPPPTPVLQYEPNNTTAKEFYPLILEKLRGARSSDSDENYNKSSSPEMALELHNSDPSAGSGDSDDAPPFDDPDAEDPEDINVDDYDGCPEVNPSSGEASCEISPGASLSESVDGEDEDDDEVLDDVDDDDDDDDEECDEDEDEEDEDDDDEDVISSSGDDLPSDEQNGCDDAEGVAGLANNAFHSSRNSSSGGEGRSRSDNTTHSYSSLLLEEEDDIVPVSLQFVKDSNSADLDVSNGNKIPSASCSDSESPTEPLTQRLAAILRSKCGISNGDN